MKLVILDRDGVINHDSADHVRSPEDFRPIAGSLEAIARLNKADYRVVVATNQSGVARGYFDLDTLARIHARLRRELAAVGGHIDALFYCPHGPDDGCDCRKPAPGMLREAGARMAMGLAGVPVIGDSRRDLEAALAVGAQPILVRTGKGAALAETGDIPAGVPVYADLAAAVDALLEEATA